MAFLFILFFILTLNAGNHMLIPHLLLHNILSAEVEQSCHCPVLHFLCPLSSSHKEFKNKKMHRNGCLTQNQKTLHCYVRLLSILRVKRCLYLLKVHLLQWAHNQLTQIQVWWSHHVIYKSKFCTPAFWPSPCSCWNQKWSHLDKKVISVYGWSTKTHIQFNSIQSNSLMNKHLVTLERKNSFGQDETSDRTRQMTPTFGG